MRNVYDEVEFNATIGLVKKHRTANVFNHEQPLTPVKLMREITDQITVDLDSTIGIMFTVEWAVYLKELGYSNLTVITDKYDRYVDAYCKNIVKCEYRTLEQIEGANMKFDVVVGNPPYQNSSHKAKKNSMWKEFLAIATKISSTVAFVIPSSFTAPSPTFNKYKRHISKISFDVKKHFSGVGSSFCYVFLHHEIQSECSITTKDENFAINLTKIDCLPETISTLIMTETEKVFLNNRKWNRTCEYHTQNLNAFEENGTIEVIHGTAIKKTNIDHENNSKIRVYCPTTTYPVFKICQNKGLSQNQVWTECFTIEEARELCDYLNSEKVQTILRNYKWSNMYYPQIISKLGISDER